MTENYPPHIVYTDENMKNLSFKQINDEFNRMLEYALGTSLCPKCSYVSWLNGDGGACNAQGRPESENTIAIKYWDLCEEDKEEKAMKLLLKNPEIIRDNFYWECHTCYTKFLSKVVWEILGEKSKMDGDKKEDIVLDELNEIKDGIIDDIDTIIDSKWDAPIVQKDIQEKIKTYRKLNNEFLDLYDKNRKEKNNE